MIVCKFMLICIWLVLCPAIIGNWICQGNENDIVIRCVKKYIVGLAAELTVFQLIALIMTLLKQSLTLLTVLWVISIIALLIISIFSEMKRGKDGVIFWKRVTTEIKSTKKWNTETKIVFFCVFVLLAFQVIFVTLHVHDDGDDAWYVGTAVVSYFTNTINRISPYTGEWMSSLPPDYTLSPWPVFCAVLGKLSRCHPAIIMHTFVPIIFIPMAYAVYAMIAAKLFDGNKEKVSWFLLFLCMINIFGYWSIRSTSTFLLFRIWQGKAILCNIIIPAVIYMFMDFVEEAEHKKTDKLMKLFLVIEAGTTVSSMGVILIPVMLAALCCVYSMIYKKMKVCFEMMLCLLPCFLQIIMFYFMRW